MNENEFYKIIRSVKKDGLRERKNRSDDYDRKIQDNENINLRNQRYTQILDTFFDYFKPTLEFKNKQRKSLLRYFKIILAIIIGVSLYFIYFILKKNSGFDFNSLATILAATVPFVSSLLVIPTKMVDFIFNKEDEKYISEIIKNIQDYDKHVRTGLNSEEQKNKLD